MKRKQQIQPIQYFTTKLPLQESWLQYCPREAVVFGCLPCRRIVYTRSVFCPREALLHVVKVVLVVFPTQQAASKQHDTTLSIHLRCPSVPQDETKNKQL